MGVRVNISKDIERNPLMESFAELHQAGLEYLQRGQWRKAADCLSSLAERLPDDDEIATLLDEATFKLSLEEQQSEQRWRHVARRIARSALVGTIILLSAFSLALVLGATFQYQANQAEARRQYETHTEMSLSLQEAEQYLKAGQYAEAEELYGRLLGQYPDNEEAQRGLKEAREQAELTSLYSQALMAESQGQLSEALRQWGALEELKPGYRDAAEHVASLERSIRLMNLFGRAEQNYQEQRWQQAIELYRELQSEAPQFEAEKVSAHLFESYVGRGFELLVGERGVLPARDISEARDLFTQALVLRPREPQAILGRDLVKSLDESRTRCGEEQACFLAGLEDLYTRGTASDQGMLATLIVRMHLSLAEGLEADGNLQLALKHYKRAADLDMGGEEGVLAEEGIARLAAHFTPTPTPTPIPTEMSVATPTTDFPKAQVKAALLNLRAGPGNRYRILASLPKGFLVAVTGISGNKYWVKVQTELPDPAGEGWLHISYLTFPEGLPELEVVTGK